MCGLIEKQLHILKIDRTMNMQIKQAIIHLKSKHSKKSISGPKLPSFYHLKVENFWTKLGKFENGKKPKISNSTTLTIFQLKK